MAANCAQAEVAAKAAFILGPDAGTAFLQKQGLAGLFVDASGTWRAAGSWPTAMSKAGEAAR